MDKTYGISVRSVLEMEVLKGAKLIAGRGGLDRVVTSMNVMEVPDIIDWVSGGELIVTTAYSIKDDVEKLVELVPALNSRGVVGLGIKPKRYIRETPQAVINAANALSFPIFEIPPEVSFSKIITPVLTTIVNNQAQVLMDIYDLQKSLTATMLSGGNLQAITQTLHNRYGNSVAIYNEFFSSYVISATYSRRDAIYRQMENCVRDNAGERHGSDNALSWRELCKVDGRECSKITVPIYSDKKLYGYIFMWEDNREVTSVDLAVIEASTSLIALEMLKKISLFEMENNHKVSFLDDLLVNDELSQRKALANAEYFDFDIEAIHQVAVVQVINSHNSLSLSNGALYKMNNNIVRVLRRLSRSASYKLLFVNKCDNIVLVFEQSSRSPALCKQEVSQFMEVFGKALADDGCSSLSASGSEGPTPTPRTCGKAAPKPSAPPGAVLWAGCGSTISRIWASTASSPVTPFRTSYSPSTPRPSRSSSTTTATTTPSSCGRSRPTSSAGATSKNSRRSWASTTTPSPTASSGSRNLPGVSFDNADQLLNLQIALKIYDVQRDR